VRLFYATDVHGSTRCFTKFVNAAEFYGADAVLLGGDITGKAIVPLVAENGRYRGHFLGEPAAAERGEELDALEKKIAATGYYAWRCSPDEEAEVAEDAGKREALFVRLIVERVEEWMTLAAERLEPLGIPCLVNAGNDDPHEIDAAIEASGWVDFLEGRVVELPDGTPVASCGYANMTPWACPRDVEEDDLARRLDDVIAKLDDPGRAIFNFHCPPYGTGIDDGPKLGANYRVTAGAGGVEMVPVGSKACRAAIERHQPLLGLHGHLHESRGTHMLGRTLCVNPGSEYTEGVLRGALFELKKGKLKSHQFTAG
jgi:Icc-related predicted phosphoesterase